MMAANMLIQCWILGEKALWEQGTGWTQSKRIGSDGLEGYHSLGMWIEKKQGRADTWWFIRSEYIWMQH